MSNPVAMQNPSTSTSRSSRYVANISTGQQQASNNRRRQSYDEGHRNAKSDCRCLVRAVAVIEEIEIQRQHASAVNADVILSLQRRALDRCDTLLQCKDCANVSHSVMLLLLLCDKLPTSPLWSEKETESPGLPSEADQRSFEADDGGERYHGPRIHFGEYEVSSLRERTQVIRALHFCFTQRLMELLRRFEGLAALKGWQTQLMMVVNLKNRIGDQARSSSFG